jgi:hypothetical protein
MEDKRNPFVILGERWIKFDEMVKDVESIKKEMAELRKMIEQPKE